MGNLGGGEVLVILLVALIVLGPTKLPPAIRQIGKVVGEVRRIGQGFQQELREAAQPLQETLEESKEALKAADKEFREAAEKPIEEKKDTLKAADKESRETAREPIEEMKETLKAADKELRGAEPSKGEADSGPDSAAAGTETGTTADEPDSGTETAA